MQKIEYNFCSITQSYLFSALKEVRINSTHNLIMKIQNKKELRNIATNHSANIDYKDFMRIYRKCIREPYSFLAIDTTLPVDNSLRFRKNLIFTITLTNKLKTLDDKIRANQAKYDVDRKTVKISALFSKELDKCEYLTGEDLQHKPGVVEQAKYEYSPLGKVFKRGLEKEDKKEELLKKLQHIEDTNETKIIKIIN